MVVRFAWWFFPWSLDVVVLFVSTNAWSCPLNLYHRPLLSSWTREDRVCQCCRRSLSQDVCTSPQLLYFSWTLACLALSCSCQVQPRCEWGTILNWRCASHCDYWSSSFCVLYFIACFSLSHEGVNCRQNDKYLSKCAQSLQPALSIAVASFETISLC